MGGAFFREEQIDLFSKYERASIFGRHVLQLM